MDMDRSKKDILKDLTNLVSQLDDPRLKALGSADTTLEILSRHPQTMTSRASSQGISCIIRAGNQNADQTLVQAILEREVVISEKLQQIGEDLCPKVLGVGLKAPQALLITEDYSDYEVLQTRLLTESKVDHGITCNTARLMAKLHNATCMKVMGEQPFQDLCQQFKSSVSTAANINAIFVAPFRPENLPSQQLPELRKVAEQFLANQQFTICIEAMKQLFENTKDSAIHGNFNTASIITKDGNAKVIDGGFATVGPCAFDLGTLVAHYIIGHYSHMLTEQNNDFHRQISYRMQDAISKTMDTYMEEQMVHSSAAEKNDLISHTAGFAGLELVRRMLDRTDPSQVELTESVRLETFRSGQRLLHAQGRIDNFGRLVMIGLQLC